MNDAALVLGPTQRVLHGFTCLLIDERSDQNRLIQRIANRKPRVNIEKSPEQSVGDALVDDQPAQRRAPLAGGSDRCKDDRAQRQLQVGRRCDNQPVVAAEFQERPAKAGRNGLGHGTSHGHGACSGNQGQIGGLGQGVAGVRSVPDDEIDHAPRHLRHFREHSLDNALTGDRTQRRFLRRLPDDRIAADQRDHGVPRPDRHGEIKSRDHTDRPERMPLFGQPMTGTLAGDRQAIELPAQPYGKIAQVDHFLHLAQRLLRDLAGFPANEKGQFRLDLAKLFADAADQLTASGAGTMRQTAKESAAARTTSGTSSGRAAEKFASSEPSIGERIESGAPLPSRHRSPRAIAASRSGTLSRLRMPRTGCDLAVEERAGGLPGIVGARGEVILSKPVGDEVVIIHVLLPDEASVGELSGQVQIEGRADAGRRRDLDRADRLPGDPPMVDLAQSEI